MTFTINPCIWVSIEMGFHTFRRVEYKYPCKDLNDLSNFSDMNNFQSHHNTFNIHIYIVFVARYFTSIHVAIFKAKSKLCTKTNAFTLRYSKSFTRKKYGVQEHFSR